MKRNILRLMLLALLLAGSLTAGAQTDRGFIRSGNKLYRMQKYAEAETEYLKALGKNPRNTQAMYNLGCALLMQQKDSAAVEQLEKAGKAETSKVRKAQAYHNIGVICQNHQMYQQAIEAYKESLRNNPSDNETRYNLALCKRQQKNQNNDNNQKQQNKDKNKDKDKNQQQQQQQNKDKQQQNKDKNQQQQQANEKMSKDNAERLLDAAIQEEKATQQRMKQQQQAAQRRRLEKNW